MCFWCLGNWLYIFEKTNKWVALLELGYDATFYHTLASRPLTVLKTLYVHTFSFVEFSYSSTPYSQYNRRKIKYVCIHTFMYLSTYSVVITHETMFTLMGLTMEAIVNYAYKCLPASHHICSKLCILCQQNLMINIQYI